MKAERQQNKTAEPMTEANPAPPPASMPQFDSSNTAGPKTWPPKVLLLVFNSPCCFCFKLSLVCKQDVCRSNMNNVMKLKCQCAANEKC